MSDDNDTKETRLDRATEWALLIAAGAVAMWATVTTILNVLWWCAG